MYDRSGNVLNQHNLLNCDFPNEKWIHAIEIWTVKRIYRLFTDNYDTK